MDAEKEKSKSNDPNINVIQYMGLFVETVASSLKLRQMEQPIKQERNLPNDYTLLVVNGYPTVT